MRVHKNFNYSDNLNSKHNQLNKGFCKKGEDFT